MISLQPTHALLCVLLVLVVAVGEPNNRSWPGSSVAQAADPAPEKDKDRKAILALINQLPEVSQGDIGYMASVAGNVFIPLDADGEVGVALLFQAPPVRSQVLQELVKHGAAALPHLITHLDDKRATKLTVQPGLGMTYLDVCDINRRTTKDRPIGEAKPGLDGNAPPIPHDHSR